MPNPLVDELSKLITDAKIALNAKTDNVSERQEVVERAVHDLTTKLSVLTESVSRKGEYNTDERTPQADHVIKTYGKVTFNDLLTRVNPYPDDYCVKGLQEKADLAYLLGTYTYLKSRKQGYNNQVSMDQAITSTRYFQQFNTETEPLRRALSTGAVGAGLEFIPTEFSRDLVDRVNLGLKVAALHRRINIPRSPYVLPAKISANPMGFKIAERTTDNLLTQANQLPSVFVGTRNVTFNAVGIGGIVVFSTEEEEDSIIPILPFARDELVISIQNAYETSVINGSVTVPHEDYDIANGAGVAQDVRTAWDGYRVTAIRPATDTKIDMSTFNLVNMRALRALMGKYAVNPADLAWVMSPKAYLSKVLTLPEALTVDLFGPKATVLNGQLGSIDGIPIIVSEFSRDDVSATGFNTVGGPNTKSVVQLVYRPAFLFGDVRSLRVENHSWPLTDQLFVMCKARTDFQSLFNTTTETVTGLGYNI